jgi:hypothetical protein
MIDDDKLTKKQIALYALGGALMMIATWAFIWVIFALGNAYGIK